MQPKLSKEEQQKLLEERLAKMRADKARQEKELEKQQEISRIQMNKELNEVAKRPSTELCALACWLPGRAQGSLGAGCLTPHCFGRAARLSESFFVWARIISRLFLGCFALLAPHAQPAAAFGYCATCAWHCCGARSQQSAAHDEASPQGVGARRQTCRSRASALQDARVKFGLL